MAHFMEIGIDDEVYEIEVRLEDIYYKCCRCGKLQYRSYYFSREAEIRNRANAEDEPQFMCSECKEEEEKRTAPLRHASYVAKQISLQAGKELPVEKALEWIKTGDIEYIKRCINQFVEQARREQRQERKPITKDMVILVDRNCTRK